MLAEWLSMTLYLASLSESDSQRNTLRSSSQGWVGSGSKRPLILLLTPTAAVPEVETQCIGVIRACFELSRKARSSLKDVIRLSGYSNTSSWQMWFYGCRAGPKSKQNRALGWAWQEIISWGFGGWPWEVLLYHRSTGWTCFVFMLFEYVSISVKWSCNLRCPPAPARKSITTWIKVTMDNFTTPTN